MSNDCYVASSCIANETKLVFQLTSRPHQSKLDHVKKKKKGNKNKEEEEVIGKTGHLAHSPGNKRTWKGEWGWGWGWGEEEGGSRPTPDSNPRPLGLDCSVFAVDVSPRFE